MPTGWRKSKLACRWDPDTADQLERLKQAVRECFDMTELTPLILNKLIERIEIGSLEAVDGQKQQTIVIAWRFARVV